MVGNKILVALDRSPQAETIFETALQLARSKKASLLVFHGLDWEKENLAEAFLDLGTLGDVDLYGVTLGQRRSFLERKRQEAEEFLQSFCQKAIAQGVSCQMQLHIGAPGKIICQLARESVSLIVVGCRDRRGLAEILLGSTSSYVIHHASCSVLLVREKHN
jgi:nucleotide-binding universal stress UspA family protein